MATVRRVPKSPYWIAKYRDGSCIKYRTTKQKAKTAAMKIALDWEREAELANAGELTQATVLKFANDLLDRLGHDSIGKQSTEDFSDSWLKTGVKAPPTRARYKAVVDGFLKSLGDKRSSASVGSITAQEIERFRDGELAKGKSASTADFGLKVIRAMMERAKRLNQRLDNPADAVTRLSVTQQERKPFTDVQLQKLLNCTDKEWQGMILFGAFAGVRLNDAANLLWRQIDLQKKSLTYVAAKTARRNPKANTVALHPNIVAFLKEVRGQMNPSSPVFPSLAGKKSGSAGGLSNQFTAILIGTGIRSAPDDSTRDEEPTEGRKFHELGFHSTRHYFISKLANADVPQEVRKALAGHTADRAHSKYVHLELDTQKRALEKLPTFAPKPA